MIKRSLPFAIVAALIAAGVVLSLSVGAGGRNGPSAPAVDFSAVDPDVIERLHEEGEALVYIALRESDIPLLEQTREDAMAHTAKVQESVLSILTQDDFLVTHQFPVTPGLGGYITMSGLEKLAGHPDVRGVGLSAAATLACAPC